MNKILSSIILSIVMLFVFATNVDAYTPTTIIRLEQPETPTNKNTFDLTFVTLDTDLSKTITGQCYKKGPTDADYTAFGGGFSFANGGNSGKCAVTSSVMNESGTYSFMVKATGSTATSKIVSVDFNTNTSPGTPTNYSKQKIDNCTYKISFKTADDSGKTVKVVLYRNEDSKFNLDSGTQANQINIGSNTDGSMTSFSSSNCDKERFFALRAFDVYGNGSGVVGDKNITTTITGETTTTTAAPVIVAETVVTDENTIGVNEEEGVVEGENQVDENATEEVLGEKTNSITEKIKNAANSIFSFGILAAILDFFTKIIDFIKSLFN